MRLDFVAHFVGHFVDSGLWFSTSVVLNSAEGHGRYGHGDRRKFLDTAEASAAKSAAYLDLCCQGGELEQKQRDQGIELLGRIAQVLHVMTDG